MGVQHSSFPQFVKVNGIKYRLQKTETGKKGKHKGYYAIAEKRKGSKQVVLSLAQAQHQAMIGQ